jgi:hypothetical protein
MPGIRSIVASLLTFLLLCGSGWASVCGISCGLSQAARVCTPASMTMACEHCDRTQQDVVSTACGTMDCQSAIPLQFRADEGAVLSHTNPLQIETVQVMPALVDSATTDRWRGDPSTESFPFHARLISLRL